MSNNVFKITISAVDNATATVRKVNDAFGRLTRPFTEVGKSFKSLGRELGFERIGANLKSIGRDAQGAASSIGRIVAPMAAITGIGSVAGVAALADNWAKLGRSIDNSARSIGISSGQLQSFQGAARMVGVDSETTTASLDSLATTMQDAKWGRNQGALLMLNKLGIGLKQTKSGAWDVIGEYKAIADAVARQDSPQKQALIANNLGLGGMLPFLRDGAAGIERYEAMVKRLGYVMDDGAIRRGKEFSVSLAGLGIAVDGVKNSIGDKLIPVMQPLIDKFSTWLAASREWIAIDIGKAAEGFATWINSIDWKAVGRGIVDFVKGIGNLVDKLGGWQNAALLVVGVMNAGLIVSVVSLAGNLVAAGVGILGFVGILWKWQAAAEAAAVQQERLGAAGKVKGLIGKGGLLAMAGLGGWEVGTQINDHFIEGTKTGDWIGDKVARTLAFFGNKEAQDAVAINDAMSAGVTGGTDKAKAWKSFQGTDKDKAAFYQDYMQSLGWSKQAAAGIVGNGIAESNLNPNAVGDWGRARGMFQWHYDRQQEFKKWAGFDLADPRADALKQLEFANYELTQGKEKSAGSRLRSASTANEAGQIASRSWLRPGLLEETKQHEAATRGALADQLAGTPNDSDRTASAPTLATPAAAPQGPYSQGAAQPGGGKVQIEIEHKNAPEGTKVNVKTQGNAQVSGRVATTGVGALA